MEEQCGPERVLPIRRVRGWVGAESIRPRVYTRGYTRPLLCSSIRMACKGRLAGLLTPTAASQLSPNPRHCKGKRAFFNSARSPARGPESRVGGGSGVVGEHCVFVPWPPAMIPGRILQTAVSSRRWRWWVIVAGGGAFWKWGDGCFHSPRSRLGWREIPRVVTRGYPNPLLRSSIRMA